MIPASAPSARPAGLGVLLALLALAMNVLSPPGFMTAPGRGGPTIVICTGRAPAAHPGPVGEAGHRSGRHGDAGGECAFAGHGLAASPPPSTPIGVVAFAASPAEPLARADLAPGRGLAAPPPPSRGPPRLS
jgi:hypothetical protein